LRIQRQLPVPSGANIQPAAPLVPHHYTQAGLTRSQVLAILQAHRRLSIFIALAVIAVTFIVVKLMPKSYTAQATVLVNYEANDPARQVPAELFASYMLTQMELIQSRDVLQTVIEKLGLTHDPDFAPAVASSVATPTDWAEKNLRASLNIEQGKGIELLYVSATSKDREKAAVIANAVVDAYQARERERVRNPGSGRADEYSQQLSELKAKVGVAESNFAEFRQRTGLTDVSAQNDVDTQTLNSLQQQLLAVQNQRREAESKSNGDQSVSTTVLGSGLIQNLKTQLATLQSQLAQLSSTLGPEHPKVVELQSQIAATKRSLSQEVQTFSNGNAGDVTSAREMEEKMQRAVDAQRAKLVNVRKMQDEGQKLQLELESAQTVYKRALDGYDQIMFASASVVSRAKPPLESSKPNKVLLLALGSIIGILLGMIGPLGYEILFNRRLRSRDDIERDFGIPVLAEFDRIVRFT
jgi:succinoglycan biosynthesis transport protein ExoP